jgi:hypothetical protein
MDLSDNFLQVDGPLVHFTHLKKGEHRLLEIAISIDSCLLICDNFRAMKFNRVTYDVC